MGFRDRLSGILSGASATVLANAERAALAAAQIVIEESRGGGAASERAANVARRFREEAQDAAREAAARAFDRAASRFERAAPPPPKAPSAPLAPFTPSPPPEPSATLKPTQWEREQVKAEQIKDQLKAAGVPPDMAETVGEMEPSTSYEVTYQATLVYDT